MTYYTAKYYPEHSLLYANEIMKIALKTDDLFMYKNFTKATSGNWCENIFDMCYYDSKNILKYQNSFGTDIFKNIDESILEFIKEGTTGKTYLQVYIVYNNIPIPKSSENASWLLLNKFELSIIRNDSIHIQHYWLMICIYNQLYRQILYILFEYDRLTDEWIEPVAGAVKSLMNYINDFGNIYNFINFQSYNSVKYHIKNGVMKTHTVYNTLLKYGFEYWCADYAKIKSVLSGHRNMFLLLEDKMEKNDIIKIICSALYYSDAETLKMVLDYSPSVYIKMVNQLIDKNICDFLYIQKTDCWIIRTTPPLASIRKVLINHSKVTYKE
jgi:hypothetical protein